MRIRKTIAGAEREIEFEPSTGFITKVDGRGSTNIANAAIWLSRKVLGTPSDQPTVSLVQSTGSQTVASNVGEPWVVQADYPEQELFAHLESEDQTWSCSTPLFAITLNTVEVK